MPSRHGAVDGASGVQIYWQAWLPVDEPHAIVVIHHGVGEHGGRYPHAVQQLVAAGYGVYALDARGHGRSEGRRATLDRFEQLVVDLDRVVERVVVPSHAVPLFLMGYSIGGAVALAYALAHQDLLAGGVVVGCGLGPGAGVSRLQFAMASLLSASVPRCPLIRLRAADMIGDPQVVNDYEADPLVHHGRLDARVLGETAAVITRLPEEFHLLRLPLLVLHGAADITASPEGSENLFRRAGSSDKTIKVYDGYRHDLLNDIGRDRVIADVIVWLGDRLTD